ncbi:hypothetical protein L1887_55835 [Cichorium endivia]|nr:hypothetical protein L1887_55835 [Cichorium endivia]
MGAMISTAASGLGDEDLLLLVSLLNRAAERAEIAQKIMRALGLYMDGGDLCERQQACHQLSAGPHNLRAQSRVYFAKPGGKGEARECLKAEQHGARLSVTAMIQRGKGDSAPVLCARAHRGGVGVGWFGARRRRC